MKEGKLKKIFICCANMAIITTILFFSAIWLYLLSRYLVIQPVTRAAILIIPLSIIFLIWAFKSGETLKINIGLIILLAIPMFYIFEIFQPGNILYHLKSMRQMQAKDYDKRTIFQVLDDLRRHGKNAYIWVMPQSFFSESKVNQKFTINGKRIFPLGAISDSAIVVCNESGEWCIYQSDEHGFNNPKGLYSPGEVDIAIIGDSFVQGHCVAPSDNFVSIIRNRYPKTINFGVGGTGPLASLAIFREYVERLKPKLVLWAYTKNTLNRIQDEGGFLGYLRDGYNLGLFDAQPQIDKKLKEYFDYVEKYSRISGNILLQTILLKQLRSKIASFLQKVKFRRNGIVYNYDTEKAQELFSKTLITVDNSVRSWGGRLIFVYLNTSCPNPNQFSERRDIISLVGQLEIPIIDITEPFQKLDDPLSVFPRRRCAHFNKDGYRLTARTVMSSEIFEKLQKDFTKTLVIE